MEFGLNLYSVRDFIKTEQDFEKTAKSLKEMGYSFLQYSGAEFDKERIKRVSENTGMPVRLTHVPMKRILEETEKLVDEHLFFGCKNIGLGAMPKDCFYDESLCKETIDKLNKAGELMVKNGCKFFYHNHFFEFLKFADGELVFDYMIKNAEFINFTLDTYWVQYSGVDVVKFIGKLKGRIDCVHLKDYSIIYKAQDNVIEPAFAPVGYGTLDFNDIIGAMKKAEVKYYFVEQDNANTYADPLGEVRKSINYLKNNF